MRCLLLLSLLVDGLDWKISSQKLLEITKYPARVDLSMSCMLKSPMKGADPDCILRLLEKVKMVKYSLLEQSACNSNKTV